MGLVIGNSVAVGPQCWTRVTACALPLDLDFRVTMSDSSGLFLTKVCPCIGEPTFRGLFGLQVLGVAVLLHVAFVERSAWVEEHAHVVVGVVFEPDADAGCSVES